MIETVSANKQCTIMMLIVSLYQIQLNVLKTAAIILGSANNSQRIGELQLLPLVANSQVIDLSPEVKSLGLTISSILKRDKQVANIIHSTNGSLAFMYSKCRNLSFKLKIG